MNKTIDFNKKIIELVREYPELIDIMKGLGFNEIVKPGMLNTLGKIMTLPKGAAMRGIDIDVIRKALEEKGFKIIEQEARKWVKSSITEKMNR